MYIIQKIKLLIVLLTSILFLNSCLLEKYTTTEYFMVDADSQQDAINEENEQCNGGEIIDCYEDKQ